MSKQTEKNAAKDEEKRVREKACEAALVELLDKHQCALEVAMLITTGGNLPQVVVRAK